MTTELVYFLVFGAAWAGRHITDVDGALAMAAALGGVLTMLRWTMDTGRRATPRP